MQIEGGKVEVVTDFLFLGSKITADGDCSHEIRRQFLLDRNTIPYLDSVFKSGDTTLPTKVHLIKAMISSSSHVQMWELDNKKDWRIDAFKQWCRRLLRVPWTARRSNQSILKEINPEYLLEGLILKLKLQYFGHLMWRANSLEKTLMLGKTEGRRRRRWRRMRWLGGIIDSMDMSLHKLRETVRDGGLAYCSSWGHKESETTERLNSKNQLKAYVQCSVTAEC